MYAASAIAANTIARSACGAAAPLFTNQMFDKLGVGGGGSLIGGIATLLAIIPFMFYKYGRQIRIRSKFAPVKDKEALREKDEERNAPDSSSPERPVQSSGLSNISSTSLHDDEAVRRGDGLIGEGTLNPVPSNASSATKKEAEG